MSMQSIIAHLEFVRSMSHKILAGFPEDKLCHQRSASDNHPLWAMGHIASTDVWIGSALGIEGMITPDNCEKLFGMGSKPTGNIRDYPPVADLRKAFEHNRALLLNWFRTATPAQLAISLKEKSGGFLEDPTAALLLSSWHEGWHFGQVATLRKDLGLPSAFGG